MRQPRTFFVIAMAIVTIFLTDFFGSKFQLLAETLAEARHPSSISVPTPVAGESWLSHLHRSFDETSMAKTARLGPLHNPKLAEENQGSIGLPRDTTDGSASLSGYDLYRINCRGCHGEDGLGAPPEINSIINPVRATSVAAILERMKKVGMAMSRADAAKLAQESKQMLLDRLHHGGKDMPAFPHLREPEIAALLAYLQLLSGVPAPRQISVRETRSQVGEHLVKSTCHVCHSAAGENPSVQQLYEGAIPPLNTLTLRVTRAQFIRKVTEGAPILMGTPQELHRGRMPVFYYLSEEEAADTYLYLTRYPPYEQAVLDPNALPAPALARTGPSDPEPGEAATSAPVASEMVRTSMANGGLNFPVLPLLIGLGALAAIAFGFAFTVSELRRVSNRDEARGTRSSKSTRPLTGESNPQSRRRSDPQLVA